MANNQFKEVEEKLAKSTIKSVSKFEELSAMGNMDLSRRQTNAVFGFNQQKINIIAEDLRLNSGYAFFVRPLLNLMDKNIRMNRIMGDLLDEDELSINRIVRCTLDPRLMYNYSKTGIKSALIDNEQAFIPILTNALKTISGGQDRVTPIYVSKEGVRKEQYFLVDGTFEINGQYEINATFRNSDGNIIGKLMRYWCMWNSFFFEGMVDNSLDYKLAGEIPYTTRVYRLVMDSTLTRVECIMASGYSVPVNFTDGQLFDMNTEIPFSDSNKELQYVFKSVGYMVDDPILIAQFNETTAVVNPEFGKLIDGKETSLVKIPRHLISIYRYRGYPYINPDTRELEWYIPEDWIY